MRFSRFLAIPVLVASLFSAGLFLSVRPALADAAPSGSAPTADEAAAAEASAKAQAAANANARGSACFCYGTKTGAVKTAGPTDAKTCLDACAKLPNDDGYHWAPNYDAYPGANLRCWEKRSDCEANLDGDTAGTVDGTWSATQPSECLPGSHYCYASDSTPTYLNVPIGAKKYVLNVGEYVGVIYNYLVGFAMTVAIVFLMIGGLRYVIGGVSAESVKGSKKMMTQAIEGFVLLMFSFVILYTVSPQLIKLQVPRLPMLKKVTIMNGNDCGAILGLAPGAKPDEIKKALADDSKTNGTNAKKASDGAVVRYTGEPVCGTTAEVLFATGGVSVADGKTCNFGYCADSKGCAVVNGKGNCVACEEVTDDNALGLVPSTAICESIVYPTQKYDGKDVPTGLCAYVFSPVTLGGTCGRVNLNCSNIGSCTQYYSVPMSVGSGSSCVGVLGYFAAFETDAVAKGASMLAAGGSYFTISDFCSKDYCAAAPTGEGCAAVGPICINSDYAATGEKTRTGAPSNVFERAYNVASILSSCSGW